MKLQPVLVAGGLSEATPPVQRNRPAPKIRDLPHPLRDLPQSDAPDAPWLPGSRERALRSRQRLPGTGRRACSREIAYRSAAFPLVYRRQAVPIRYGAGLSPRDCLVPGV